MIHSHETLRLCICAGLSALSGASGLGGGSLYSAVNLLVLTGEIHTAIPLSKPTVLGTAVGGTLCFWNRDRFLGPDEGFRIHFTIVSLLEPATMLGALFGVIVNTWLNDTLLLLIFLTTCSFTLFKTLKAADAIKKHSNYELVLETLDPGASLPLPAMNKGGAESLSEAHSSDGLMDLNVTGMNADDLPSEASPRIGSSHHYLIPESQKTWEELGEPVRPMVTLAGGSFLYPPSPLKGTVKDGLFRNESWSEVMYRIWSLVTNLGISKTEERRAASAHHTTIMLALTSAVSMTLLYYGGGPMELFSGDFRATGAYLWLISVVVANAWVFYNRARHGVHYALCQNEATPSLDAIEARQQNRGNSAHQRAGSTLTGVKGVSRRQAAKLTAFVLVSGFCSGVLAAMIGVGGGMIKVPLLLYLGVSTADAVATSLYMVLFTSLSTTSMFAMAGRLKLSSIPSSFIAGFIGTIIGIVLVKRFIISKPSAEYHLTRLISLTMFCCIFAIILVKFNPLDMIDTHSMGAYYEHHPVLDQTAMHEYLSY